ncbi:MAG: DUF1819 family protein [Clostridiaceae bacterium]|nr:DUF1819 family protein [Clostridiaceae bacterium]
MTINRKKYDASFTAAGLLYSEFIAIKDILLSDSFEDRLKLEAKENKLLQIPTQAARKRIIIEIRRRQKNAPFDFWNLFFEWNEQEQKLGLLFLCLKTYPLMLDFHIEIALKKYNIGSSLEAYDITMRLDELSTQYENVASWTYRTKRDLNSKYRKVIREAGLYDGKNLTKPLHVNHQFWNYFSTISESWFLDACFQKR